MGEARPGSAARVVDAAGLAHDLANVITVLTASSAMLQDDLADLSSAHPAREQAARVALAAARAGELCERLRVPLGSPAPAPRAAPDGFDLAAAVAEAGGLIGPALHPATLICETSEPLRVRGTALDAFQIVLNLALNAAEAGGGTVHLRADHWVADRTVPLFGRLVPGRAYARLTVSDDGPGLPADKAALFARGVSGSGVPGRGTGLATVVAIIERAGGAVLARDGGGGACLAVMWPLDLSAPATGVLAGASVLVVAGTSGPTAIAADMLEAAGAEPSLCLDPTDAIASVSKDRGAWDAVVVAGPARGLSADEIATRLRDADPGLPCVTATHGTGGHELAAALYAAMGDES